MNQLDLKIIKMLKHRAAKVKWYQLGSILRDAEIFLEEQLQPPKEESPEWETFFKENIIKEEEQ